MTINELLEAMIGAYKGFDDSAVAATIGAFRQKLEKFEGKELASAWVEVVSGFDPTARKPYPLPKDFEEVLPKPRRMRDGPTLDIKGHGERRAKLLADWELAQRPDIEAEFGPRIGVWCSIVAQDRAHNLAWKPEGPEKVRLDDEAIAKVVQGVVSQDRMDTFGGISLRGDGHVWQSEMERCRAHVLAGRYSHKEIVAPVQAPGNYSKATRGQKPRPAPTDEMDEPLGDESHAES